MPMPHRTFAQVAKRRLIGKEGRERIREVQALIAELPDYRNGPYADLRKSLLAELGHVHVVQVIGRRHRPLIPFGPRPTFVTPKRRITWRRGSNMKSTRSAPLSEARSSFMLW